jgi:hypothetical protein
MGIGGERVDRRLDPAPSPKVAEQVLVADDGEDHSGKTARGIPLLSCEHLPWPHPSSRKKPVLKL